MANTSTAAENKNKLRNVVIVDGLRTPFLKSGTEFNNLGSLALLEACTRELIQRNNLNPEVIDQVIVGSVIAPLAIPNLGRDLVLALGLPKKIPGFGLSMACMSGVKSLTSAYEAIVTQQAEVVLAGGVESLSNVPVAMAKTLVDIMRDFPKAKTIPQKIKMLEKIKSLKDVLPVQPAIAEFYTGKTMGEHAEMMAKLNHISRADQDQFAYDSHQKAAAAIADGRLKAEVVPVSLAPKFKKMVEDDNLVRADTTIEKLASLKPVFDRKFGSVTAGNASPITDGAACLLVMSEEKAKKLGYEPKSYLRSFAYAALDPWEQLLLGPALAVPEALKKAGITMEEVDLIDMHEAFASQVLSTVVKLEDQGFCKERLGLDRAYKIDRKKLNVMGGSISLGHPFGATGGRMVTSMSNELIRRNKKYALLTLCAAGGMGVALVLENARYR